MRVPAFFSELALFVLQVVSAALEWVGFASSCCCIWLRMFVFAFVSQGTCALEEFIAYLPALVVGFTVAAMPFTATASVSTVSVSAKLQLLRAAHADAFDPPPLLLRRAMNSGLQELVV